MRFELGLQDAILLFAQVMIANFLHSIHRKAVYSVAQPRYTFSKKTVYTMQIAKFWLDCIFIGADSVCYH